MERRLDARRTSRDRPAVGVIRDAAAIHGATATHRTTEIHHTTETGA